MQRGLRAVDHVLEVLAGPAGTMSLGEVVNQSEHALQTAANAEVAGAQPALIAAALLHDFGHFIEWADPEPDRFDRRDHARLGADYLSGVWGPDVTEPIRLHVVALSSLCEESPDYLSTLSPVVRSAVAPIVQPVDGNPAAVERWSQESLRSSPFGVDALQLRRWDDRGKVPGRKVPDLAHFRHYLEETIRPDQRCRE